MKRIYLQLFLSFFIVSLAQAQSTTDLTEGCGSIDVTFTAPSGYNSWYWDFDGAGIGSTPTTSTTFTQRANPYEVKFYETNGGPQIGNSIFVEVYPKPTIALPPSEGCINAPISLSTTISNAPSGLTIDNYSWTFGDLTGANSSTGNISHTYGNSNINGYDISVGIQTSIPSCNVNPTFSQVARVSDLPNASFSPSQTSSCLVPLTVSFTNNSSSTLPLTYDWQMANGGSSTSMTPPDEIYTTDGSYTTTLTVTNSYGCTKTRTRSVSIGTPSASFIMDETVCMGEENITNTSSSPSGTYEWTFEPAGSGIANQTRFTPTGTFSTAGTYTVSLDYTSTQGCSAPTVTKTIVVEDSAIVTFTTDPIFSCSSPTTFSFLGSSTNNVAQWIWVLADGTLKNTQSFTHDFAVKDSTYHEQDQLNLFPSILTIQTTAGCYSPPFTLTDTIVLPWARFMPDTAQGCVPLTVKFSDSSRYTPYDITNWEWDFGDGSPTENYNSAVTPSHTYTTPGTYSVSLVITTDPDDCTDTSHFIIIKVGEEKALSFTANKTDVCPGETVSFTNTTPNPELFDGWNYSSDGGDFFSHCYQDDNIQVSFNDSIGPQSIVLSADYNGCISSDTLVSINVKGPIADIGHLQDCLTPDDVQFTDNSLGATSTTWSFGNGLSTTDTLPAFSYTYSNTGNYTVFLTAENNTSGCPNDTKSATIYIRHPEAKFAFDTLLCQNVDVYFDASASNSVHANCYQGYTWLFPNEYDDTLNPLKNKRPITSSNPLLTTELSTTGYHEIGLIVTDINGCTDTIADSVQVFGISSAFTIDDLTICLPDTIEYVELAQLNSDTTIIDWFWEYGDGPDSIYSGQNLPEHIYKKEQDEFDVQLITIDTLGCTDTTIQTIVKYNIESEITTNPSVPNICLGKSILFTASDFPDDGSYLSYEWDFDWNVGDTLIDTTANGIYYTYDSAASYTVQVVFTEVGSGCLDSTTKTVNVQDIPVAGYNAIQDTALNLGVPVCYNNSIIKFVDTSTIGGISARSLTTAKWSVDSVLPYTIRDEIDPNAFDKGSHSVELIVTTTYGCADTTLKTFNVEEPNAERITIDDDLICKGETITFTMEDPTDDVNSYTWSFGDGSPIVPDQNPIPHTYNATQVDPFPVVLVVKGSTPACQTDFTTSIYVTFVKSDFSISNDTVCLNDTVIFTNSSSGADTYAWDLGNGITETSEDISYVYSDSGSYTISLLATESEFECDDDTINTVYVQSLPELSVIGDSVCKYDKAQLLVTNFNAEYDYVWHSTKELNDSTIHNPNLTGIESNTYIVTATDEHNCVSTDSAFVEVYQPLEGFNFDTTIVVGDSITLPLTKQNERVSFVWTPEAGLSCTDCAYPIVQPLEDIIYVVEMDDSCSEASARFTITVKPDMFIKLPTTFTPNGDGANDIIYVKGWGIKDLVSFEIYNRWGELIFSTSDIEEGWDGFYKGKLQNNDTYAYKVIALSWRDTELLEEGHINLMR